MALLLAMLVADDDDNDDGDGVSLPALRYPAMLYIEITSWKARAYGIFRHELVKYLKSNEWAQRTSEISDTKPTSVKIPYKALSML